jgi:hypothetical protein
MSSTADELEHKIGVLHRHCDAIGRDPAEIRMAASLMNPFDDLDAYFRTAESFAQLGIAQLMVGPMPGTPDPVGFVTRLGDEVIPRLTALG